MDRGSYVATSAGMLQFRKLDIVNNNLANINTPGFKKQVLVSDEQTFDETLASIVAKDDPYAKADHARSPGTSNVRSVTDYSLGPIKPTGNSLDVALKDPRDFFVLNTATGPQFTRAGNFTLNTEGALVTPDGTEVAGDGGTITINGVNAKIAEDGSVMVNNLRVGKLQVVRFENTDGLERVGGTRFALPQGKALPEPVEARLETQSLEMSNVSAISSVIDLIAANRAFDMYTKSMQSIDALNTTAIQQVGRPR